jgi:hypothetical protein
VTLVYVGLDITKARRLHALELKLENTGRILIRPFQIGAGAAAFAAPRIRNAEAANKTVWKAILS